MSLSIFNVICAIENYEVEKTFDIESWNKIEKSYSLW